jgi:hypothetical protein
VLLEFDENTDSTEFEKRLMTHNHSVLVDRIKKSHTASEITLYKSETILPTVLPTNSLIHLSFITTSRSGFSGTFRALGAMLRKLMFLKKYYPCMKMWRKKMRE